MIIKASGSSHNNYTSTSLQVNNTDNKHRTIKQNKQIRFLVEICTKMAVRKSRLPFLLGSNDCYCPRRTNYQKTPPETLAHYS